MEVTLRIFRGTNREETSSFSNFTLEGFPTDSLLDLLMKAKMVDRSIMFRHSCHHGSCGTCACIIDGTEKLACRTFLSDFPEGAIINLEPLHSFPLIRDLVTDPGSMFADIEETWPYLKKNSNGGVQFEACIECGACMSACPVSDPFIGPAPLALLDNGASACRRHIACSRVCPQNVAPARRIQQLKKELE